MFFDTLLKNKSKRFFKKSLVLLLFVFDENSPSRVVRRQLCGGSCAAAVVLQIKARHIFQKII